MAATPSMAVMELQISVRDLVSRFLAHAETWLEKERDQLPLWLPVGLGGGVGGWFVLPGSEEWLGIIIGGLALASAGLTLGWNKRLGRVIIWAGFTVALGCGLAWGRATLTFHQVLDRPVVVEVHGLVERSENKPAEDKVRVTLRTDGLLLPERVRVTIKDRPIPDVLQEGAQIKVRARLAPPPVAALPGGHDFSRAAWFLGLGGVGQAIGDVFVVAPAANGDGFQQSLSTHVRERVPGSAGGIAAAFASGDRGGIAPEDEDAMRASGLTHLLSISGLHVTAVVGAAIFLALRLMALSPLLALRLPLVTLAGGFGAAAGIGYTLLTGAEVPTIRTCVAALLVLLGLAIGREALTLRLVAAGALIVLFIWPEALVGPSFQLSFAAIASIIAFHDIPAAKSFLARREESWLVRFWRNLAGLFMTGLVVELTLAPIAFYHFHRSGVYGALANLIAIPLTTFVTMPVEALALIFDLIGWGKPFWWLTGLSLNLLLALAREVESWPGAVALVPEVPLGAYAMMIGGGLWLMLWSTRVRLMGLAGILVGIVWTVAMPLPDILITDDGRHMAIRTADGDMALLRERSGDFVRDVLAERAGLSTVDLVIEDLQNSDCTQDICTATIRKDGHDWMVGATRSAHLVKWQELISLCKKLDIMLSERRLPEACKPRWLKIDRATLRRTGGLAISLGDRPAIQTSRGGHDDHPWAEQSALNNGGASQRAYPARGRD